MKDIKPSDTDLKTENTQLTDEEKVTGYIMGTLLYTPQVYVKSADYVEIMVYAPNENHPSMKIFRMIGRCVNLLNTPEGYQEIDFQDEVNILTKEGMGNSTRWQVNFSVFVNKETFDFVSIHNRPKSVNKTMESVQVFTDLVKRKGSRLYAGSWRFESDGQSWIPQTNNGAIPPPLKTLFRTTPAIENK